ncbi:MAG: GNAT family N-acetyltransferase [Vicinamibacterales bacterium]
MTDTPDPHGSTSPSDRRHAEVRRATADDIAALVPLVCDYWVFEGLSGFDASHVAGALAQLLSDGRLGAVWLARIDGAAVGYLIAVYVFSLEHLGLTAELDELYVGPDHRASGVGASLLRAAEAAAAEAGCTNVSLQLGRHNDGARRFYVRHGYSDRQGFDLLEKPFAPHPD